MRFIVFLFLVCSLQTFAQTKQDSVWLPFKDLMGQWAGTGDGVDGKGNYEATYQFVMGKRYIEIRTKTTYPPSAANPRGKSREEVGYISFDNNRRTFILRQFHSEGFVNEYTLQSISPDGKTIVFITESIENIGKGWRARETYTTNGGNEFTEVFDIGEPNKELTFYTKASFKKTK